MITIAQNFRYGDLGLSTEATPTRRAAAISRFSSGVRLQLVIWAVTSAWLNMAFSAEVMSAGVFAV